ncbi:MAG TPA: cyclic nucleotide-binding domain-containing protein [Terriglobales bacterium]|nr:cyclic nucleotide-binding domain-containing protein [Terriglobales bacterium]
MGARSKPDSDQPCGTCDLCPEQDFHDAFHGDWKKFESRFGERSYDKGECLFREGRNARGVYVLRAGEAELVVNPPGGKRIVVCKARPGTLLGLSAAIRGTPAELSAEVTRPSRVLYIPRPQFLRFLKQHTAAWLPILQRLSRDVEEAHQRVHAIRESQPRRRRPPAR